MKVVRETWIDYARGVAIILVLYRHVFEGIKGSGIDIQPFLFLEHFNIMFYSFRMPLFFIVSGVFVASSLRKRGINNFITTKARTILYPYFLWGILQITLQLMFSRYVNNPPSFADYSYLLYLPREIEQFWYLYALFNVSVLYAFVKIILKASTVVNLGIGLVFFWFSTWLHQQETHVWFLFDILHYYLFYAIGDAICKFIRNPRFLEFLQSWKFLVLMLFPFILTQLYFLYENLNYAGQKYEYVEFYQPIRFLVIALCGCAFIINLSFVLQKTQIAGWLHKLGSYSLYIYVAHVIVLAATRVLMTKVFFIYHVPWLLISGILTGLLVPVLLYKIAIWLKMPWIFSLERKPMQDMKT